MSVLSELLSEIENKPRDEAITHLEKEFKQSYPALKVGLDLVLGDLWWEKAADDPESMRKAAVHYKWYLDKVETALTTQGDWMYMLQEEGVPLDGASRQRAANRVAQAQNQGIRVNTSGCGASVLLFLGVAYSIAKLLEYFIV